jgi:hypothetical protein
MFAYFLGYLYTFLFIVIGAFLAVYAAVLLERPRPFTIDNGLKYLSAALFILIIFGSIVNWLLDCTVNVQGGLPTFGLETHVKVIG